MCEIGNIRAFEDERFLNACLHGSAAVAASGAVVGVILFDFVAPAKSELPLVAAGGFIAIVIWAVALIVSTALVFAAHEVVHALFFKLFAPVGSHVRFGAHRETAMIYACAEGIVYTRAHYLIVTLAPTAALTLALAALARLSGYCLACFVVAALHLTGCVGDWYYAAVILGNRAIRACEDTAWGVRFLDGVPAKENGGAYS